jgi:hypothetical protein
MAQMIRVEDVMRSVARDRGPICDEYVRVTCPRCSATQTLREATIAVEGADTVYTCKMRCQRLVIVSPGQESSPWPGRGHCLKGGLIRNAVDLLIAWPGLPGQMLVPRSPKALDAN